MDICKHHHHPSLELPVFPSGSPVFIKHSTPHSPSPQLPEASISLPITMNLTTLDRNEIIQYWSFWLANFTLHTIPEFPSCHRVYQICLSFRGEQYSFVSWILFSHWSVDWHLGFIHLCLFMNNDAINMGTWVCFCVPPLSFWIYILKWNCRILSWPVLDFWGISLCLPQTGCTLTYSYQWRRRGWDHRDLCPSILFFTVVDLLRKVDCYVIQWLTLQQHLPHLWKQFVWFFCCPHCMVQLVSQGAALPSP